MFYLTKRTLIIGALLFSSAFAAPSSPKTWNIHPTDSTKIEIRDRYGELIAVQDLKGTTAGYKLFYKDGKNWLIRMKSIPATTTQAPQIRPLATTPKPAPTALTRPTAGSASTTTKRLTGHKRQRSEAQLPKSAPPTKKKKSKYDGIDFSKGVSWRVHPDNSKYLQVLDADNKVVFSDKIKTHTGKRKLHNGSLYIAVAIQTINKHYSFPRHPDDKTSLLRSDFDVIEGEKIRVLNQAPPSLYRNIDFTKVKSWRVSPNKPEHFDLLDQNGTVLHSGPVQTNKGKRLVTNNQISIYDRKKNQNLCISRHPNDKASLTDNGFCLTPPGKNASKYDGINLKTGKCWRIAPNKPGYLEILDKHRNVIYTQPVRTTKGPKHLERGKLVVGNEDRNSLPRDPEDTKDLEENGFAPNQTTHLMRDENHSQDSDSAEDLDDDSDDEDEMEFQRTTMTRLESNLHLIPESDDEDESNDGTGFPRQAPTRLESNLHLIPESDDDSDEDLPGSIGSDMDESDDNDHPLIMD